MNRTVVWAASVMGLLVGAEAIVGQAVVRGIILTDTTNTPVAGAIIEISSLSLSTTSDSNGLFLLAQVPVGKHSVRARAIGYHSRLLSVLITQHDTLRLVFRLPSAPVTLDPIVVEAEEAMALNPLMAGFARRRRFDQGEFLGPAELERLIQSPLQGVVRQMGMTIRNSKRGRPYATGRRAGTCAVQVFLDGILQPNTRDEPFDLSSVRIETLAGMEYYVGIARVPVEFARGDYACGVLVLWTRLRRP